MNPPTRTEDAHGKSSEHVMINGEPCDATGIDTVLDAVAATGVDPSQSGTAVALNGEVVPRGDWSDTQVGAGDRIEVIRAIAGG